VPVTGHSHRLTGAFVSLLAAGLTVTGFFSTAGVTAAVVGFGAGFRGVSTVVTGFVAGFVADVDTALSAGGFGGDRVGTV
jgi:hypothetical protein